MPANTENLIWIDLEMTGLDTTHDEIIEIATVITSKQLEVLAEGPVIAVYQPDEVLDGMDEWNTRQHNSSGLVERIRQSSHDARSAERLTLQFLEDWVPPGASPMCGNNICQDRRFLARLMPELEDYFHYRNLDVSSVKELARRWAPHVAASVNKVSSHLALDDIHDSIAELRHYRENFIAEGFRCPPAPT